jgi:hypothetical protein
LDGIWRHGGNDFIVYHVAIERRKIIGAAAVPIAIGISLILLAAISIGCNTYFLRGGCGVYVLSLPQGHGAG